jgi:Cu/Ag efflux protein CusF
MTTIGRIGRTGAAAVLLASLGACANLGSLGNVLGGVLGTPGGSDVTGTVQNVDTRAQQITIRQSNGQNINVGYDNQTQVLYQNRNYPVTSLEYGDQVDVHLTTTQNNSYYTDVVQVTQPVAGSNTSGSSTEALQSLQGVVRDIDRTNGRFTIDAGGGTLITVSMPYNPTRTDADRFNNLRTGNSVRFYGVYLNSNRVELRQFY